MKGDEMPFGYLQNIETYRNFFEIKRIGNDAARKAQEENRALGIPNVYSRRGKLYYELPDGRITEESPFGKFHETGLDHVPEDLTT